MTKKLKPEKTVPAPANPEFDAAVAKAVRLVSENYRKSPKKWTFDSLPYSEHFEEAVSSATTTPRGTPAFDTMCRTVLNELLRRRKAGKIIRRINKVSA